MELPAGFLHNRRTDRQTDRQSSRSMKMLTVLFPGATGNKKNLRKGFSKLRSTQRNELILLADELMQSRGAIAINTTTNTNYKYNNNEIVTNRSQDQSIALSIDIYVEPRFASFVVSQ